MQGLMFLILNEKNRARVVRTRARMVNLVWGLAFPFFAFTILNSHTYAVSSNSHTVSASCAARSTRQLPLSLRLKGGNDEEVVLGTFGVCKSPFENVGTVICSSPSVYYHSFPHSIYPHAKTQDIA
jgi:hypothetical protein